MKRQNGKPEEKSSLFGLLSVASVGVALTAHTLYFFRVLAEQIKTGWTAGATIGFGTVILWIAQAATIPFLLLDIVYFIVSMVKNGPSLMRYLAGGGALLSLLVWFGTMLLLFL